MNHLQKFGGCDYTSNTRIINWVNYFHARWCRNKPERQRQENLHHWCVKYQKPSLVSYFFIKRSEWNSFLSLLFFEVMWVVFSVISFQLCTLKVFNFAGTKLCDFRDFWSFLSNFTPAKISKPQNRKIKYPRN